jgi:hypothetical protein
MDNKPSVQLPRNEGDDCVPHYEEAADRIVEALAPHTRRSVGDLHAAAPIILAATKRGARSAQESVAATGGLIWAAFAYRRMFNRMATHIAGDPFDSPVLWADISAKVWDQTWRSSEQARDWRFAIGAGALTVTLALCAVVVQILI